MSQKNIIEIYNEDLDATARVSRRAPCGPRPFPHAASRAPPKHRRPRGLYPAPGA